MMKILIDTNIVLDLFLEREPFVEAAMILFELVEMAQVQGYVAATTITNIFYIVRKAKGRETALQAVSRVLVNLEMCAVDRATITQALNSNLKDFEDGIQFACAQLNNLDAIVTRNTSDFLGVSLPVLSVAELQVQLSHDHHP
jgi:predicted nucleic acid-binding protein